MGIAWGNWTFRIVIIIFALLIVRSLYNVGQDIVYTIKSASWPSCVGKIEYTLPRESLPKSTARDLLLSYSYEVDGVVYTGNKISFSRRVRWYRLEIKSFLENKEVGGNITVYYDPANPKISVLEPGGSNLPNAAFVAASFFVLIFLVWLIASTTREEQPVST